MFITIFLWVGILNQNISIDSDPIDLSVTPLIVLEGCNGSGPSPVDGRRCRQADEGRSTFNAQAHLLQHVFKLQKNISVPESQDSKTKMLQILSTFVVISNLIGMLPTV